MYTFSLWKHLGRPMVVVLAIAAAIQAVASISPKRKIVSAAAQPASSSFTVEQIKSYPFPNELTTAATGSRIAWAFNERGLRNIWVAEGPDFQAAVANELRS